MYVASVYCVYSLKKTVFLFNVVTPSIFLKCDQGGFPEVFHYKASSALSLSLQHLGCGYAETLDSLKWFSKIL